MNEIIAAGKTDHAAVIETLAQAFQTDPALSWILPGTEHRARALRSLFRTLVPADMRAGIALRASGDEAAARRQRLDQEVAHARLVVDHEDGPFGPTALLPSGGRGVGGEGLARVSHGAPL